MPLPRPALHTPSVTCPFKMLSRCVRIQGIGRLLTSSAARNLQQSRQFSDPAEQFQISRAIVGSLTQSFVRGSLRHEEPAEPINLELARQQHAIYVSELKKLIPIVVQVAPHESLPDLIFVEDPAVIHEGTALLTQMKPPTRAPEIELMRPIVEEMGFRVLEMSEPGAYLDGGDVTFTGREFLVGLSERTNAVSKGGPILHVLSAVILVDT